MSLQASINSYFLCFIIIAMEEGFLKDSVKSIYIELIEVWKSELLAIARWDKKN